MSLVSKALGLAAAGIFGWVGTAYAGEGNGSQFTMEGYDYAREELGLSILDGTVLGDLLRDNWPVFGASVAAAGLLTAQGMPQLGMLSILLGIGYAGYQWYYSDNKTKFANASAPAATTQAPSQKDDPTARARAGGVVPAAVSGGRVSRRDEALKGARKINGLDDPFGRGTTHQSKRDGNYDVDLKHRPDLNADEPFVTDRAPRYGDPRLENDNE